MVVNSKMFLYSTVTSTGREYASSSPSSEDLVNAQMSVCLGLCVSSAVAGTQRGPQHSTRASGEIPLWVLHKSLAVPCSLMTIW